MSMTNRWGNYKYRILGASWGALLHILIVIGIELGGEEGLGYLILLMDFPLVLLWNSLIGPVGLGGRTFALACYFGGTFMYALVGWFIGAIFERGIFRHPTSLSLL